MDQFIKDMARYISIDQAYLKPLPKTGKEYKDAESLLKPFLAHFKDQERPTVIQGFAILIKYLKHIRGEFNKMEAGTVRNNGQKTKAYFKNIQDIERAINCFTYGDALKDMSYRDANKTKETSGFFTVDKLIIQGISKKERIEIEGSALDLFKALFSAYNEAEEKQLRQFNEDLYDAHK
jgi:hypothetical protein